MTGTDFYRSAIENQYSAEEKSLVVSRPSGNTTHLYRLGGAASTSTRASRYTMFAVTGRERCPRMEPATMSGNGLGPRMGTSGPHTCSGNLNLNGTRMKFSSASIAVLDFLHSGYILKIILGAHRQPPEGAGKRQPAQEPGIYLYIWGGDVI